MSRLIPYRNAAPVPGIPPLKSEVQSRLEALTKYVPAEILAVYLPAMRSATGAFENHAWLLPTITFIIAWLCVPAYLLWIARQDDRRWYQVVVSSVAFPIWAAASKALPPIPGLNINDALVTWLLLIFSLLTMFILPQKGGDTSPVAVPSHG